MNAIKENVEEYLEARISGHRYASFDYCYNHFHPSNFKKSFDMEKSCLALGMYLASWGMYRGSGFLLMKTSMKHFEQTIEFIAETNATVWKLDVDEYCKETSRDRILGVYENIKNYLEIKKMEQKKHLTLVTKVMLGVFGIVPAFDSRFCETFQKKYGAFTSLSEKTLGHIYEFYKENKKTIDRLSDLTKTIDFHTGKPTTLNYPKAKIIDMYGFMESPKQE